MPVLDRLGRVLKQATEKISACCRYARPVGPPNDPEPLDDFELGIYVGEVSDQVELAELSFCQLDDALRNPGGHSSPDGFRSSPAAPRVGGHAFETALAYAALQDPDGSELSVGQEQARKRALMRGKTLRSVLGDLKAPSPLEERRVRNSFEHFDERLDQFLDESRSRGRIVADQNIGPIANMIITNTGPPRYLRHIDPSTGTVLVLEGSQEW